MAKKKDFVEQLVESQINEDYENSESKKIVSPNNINLVDVSKEMENVLEDEIICNISEQDVQYLKDLVIMQEDILIAIGNVEIQKDTLVSKLKGIREEQRNFENQINVKYKLDENGKYEIDFEKKKIFRKK